MEKCLNLVNPIIETFNSLLPMKIMKYVVDHPGRECVCDRECVWCVVWCVFGVGNKGADKLIMFVFLA